MRLPDRKAWATKPKYVVWPDWVARLKDDRQRRAVRGALFERDAAVQTGAERHRSCAGALRVADRLLDTLDRRSPREAMRAVAQALCRYAKAAKCRHPSHAPVWPMGKQLPQLESQEEEGVFWFTPDFEDDKDPTQRKAVVGARVRRSRRR